MTTIANVKHTGNAHWYHSETGAPMHQIPTVDGKKMKTPTIADARKLSLLPSVTTIIDSVLRKPALEMWKTEQSVLACMTAIRNPTESVDDFVKRILHDEQQQFQEARVAADLGSKLHDALEAHFQGQEMDPALKPWVLPAAEAVLKYGTLIATEKVLIGEGYAGTTDLILDAPDCWWLWDYKTTKKLPDPEKGGAWSDHRIQLSAYAAAYHPELGEKRKPIRTGNLYISTANEGKFVVCEHEPWEPTFAQGFVPLLVYWQWANKYNPGAPKEAAKVVTTPVAHQIPTAPPAKRKIVWAQGEPTPTPAANPAS